MQIQIKNARQYEYNNERNCILNKNNDCDGDGMKGTAF